MRRAAAPLAFAWLTLAGCADQMLSNDRIRNQAAMALGQPASSVKISDRRYDGMTNTFVTARTPRGTYRCTINGGGVLAMGIVNPAICTPL